MTTPANDFVTICGNAKIPLLSSKAAQLKLLKEAGVSMVNITTNLDVKGRFATLAWARHAVANSIDPVTWTSMLSGPLLTNLRTLYTLQCVPHGPLPALRAEPLRFRLRRLVRCLVLNTTTKIQRYTSLLFCRLPSNAWHPSLTLFG